ncbi:hypothetical protein PRK78_006618 [Emydomyces testavorans]|uniref:F-box domain-containing protein n=1 Tax=Emydomyces testavorans TaxID=2070801 RepID=A0AAF0DMG2_9EURO|nr:hypothetical protein PRK78_006618 [Emydomyces testavorans]
MFSAGVCAETPPQLRSLMALPLNLIALILSYLDDVGDLSRLCRTCRVLNYMTLPQLYKNITLTSYDKIRYRDELPEGCGSASPFSMGLNAIVTRNVASLVRSLTMRGEWREDGLDEHARVGRVTDSSMMLNIAVRAAIDKMTGLEKFSWELNTKMLETAYIGLAQLPKLTSLTVRFPSSRHPRPTTVIPPMPHLRALKITDIDPLCYPDDISTLLLRSKKLRELRMHWSPRMRETQEPSVTLHDYFRKCIAEKSPLRLRKVALQNFYALHTDDFETAMDPAVLEEITTLNSPGVYDASLTAMTFVENSWPTLNNKCRSIKSLRHDRIERKGCEFLATLENLERLYFVTPIRDASDSINSPRTAESTQSSTSLSPPSSIDPTSTGANGATSNSQSQLPPAPPTNLASHISLRDTYLHTIATVQGPKLRHLLLSSRWSLPGTLIARLVRSCPNLEQLAMATDLSSFETLALLIPFLRKLVAIRLLIPTGPALTASSRPQGKEIDANGPSPAANGSDPNLASLNARSLSEIVDLDDRIFNEAMGARLGDKEIFSNLKIIGLGWKAWELGEFYTIPIAEGTDTSEWVSSTEKFDASNNNLRSSAANAASTPTRPNNLSHAATEACQPSIPGGRVWNTQQTAATPKRATSTAKTVLGKRKQPPSSQPAPSIAVQPEPSIYTPNSHQIRIATPSQVPTNSHSAFPTDAAALLEDLGAKLSEDTRAKLAQCIHEPATSGEGIQWRRKVRRIGWEVLKHWEIWGLDVQQI